MRSGLAPLTLLRHINHGVLAQHSRSRQSPSHHMTKVANKLAAKSAAKQTIRSGQKALRQLPEWNLDDLYSGLDDPAIKRDLERTDAECAAFEDAYKVKLAGLASAPNGRAA